MYVPEALVPTLENALENGRRLEQLLYAQGPRVLKEFRRLRGKPLPKTLPPKRIQRLQNQKKRRKP